MNLVSPARGADPFRTSRRFLLVISAVVLWEKLDPEAASH
jgi:hypothetical protein